MHCQYTEGHAENISILLNSSTSWISAHQNAMPHTDRPTPTVSSWLYRWKRSLGYLAVLAWCINSFSRLPQVMPLCCRILAKIINILGHIAICWDSLNKSSKRASTHFACVRPHNKYSHLLLYILTLTLLTLVTTPRQSWVCSNLGPPIRGLPNRYPNLGPLFSA